MDGVDQTRPQNSREMTFNYLQLMDNYTSQYMYPYVSSKKLIVPGCNTKKDTHMSIHFFFQFAKKSFSYSHVYDKEHCNIFNMIGPPNTIRSCDRHEEHTQDTAGPSSCTSLNSDVINCINLEYHEAVYPLRISVFGDFTGMRRIWAKDPDDNWSLLWDENNDCEKTYRTTGTAEIPHSPILWPCCFKTKMLRLEYECELLRYSKRTAVMLIGTSDLILPRRLEQTNPYWLFELLDKISPSQPFRPRRIFEFAINIYALENKNILQQKSPLIRSYLAENVIQNCWNHYVICESDIVDTFHKDVLNHKHVPQEIIPDRVQCYMVMYKHCTSYKNYLNYEKFFEDIFLKDKLLWEKSEKTSLCSFSELPDEIIIKILGNLDLKSICHVSRVNKRLNNLSRDFQLYKSLNVRNIYYTYWGSDIDDILLYFAPRCKYLRQLDLSYCCQHSVATFNKFLATCGKFLTDLRLSYCPFIDNSAVLQISEICKKLKGLDLNGCRVDVGLSFLKNLKSLERLHLENIKGIRTETLCEILQNNRQMRDLNLARMYRVLNIDEVAITLKTACPNLEKINLAGTSLTSRGIDALADCKNLREVNFRNMYLVREGNITDLRNSFYRLFSSCQLLEKIDLSYNHTLTNGELKTLTLCKNLKRLKLLNVYWVTFDILRDTILHCPKLEIIYPPDKITCRFTNQWNDIIGVEPIFSSDFLKNFCNI